MVQQKQTSNEMISKLNSTLTRIPTELQIANVSFALTPSAREVMRGNPPIRSDQQGNRAFNDDLLSSLTNPDLNVVVYNLHGEDVLIMAVKSLLLKSFGMIIKCHVSLEDANRSY